MAALGAVVQHFISFPGSPCRVCLEKLCLCSQYFAISYQKIWREPPSVQPYPLVLLLLVDTVSPPLFRAYWSGCQTFPGILSGSDIRFDEVPRGMEALTDGTGIFGFLLLFAASGLLLHQ